MDKEYVAEKTIGSIDFGAVKQEGVGSGVGGGGVRQHEVGYPYPPKTGWELSLDP